MKPINCPTCKHEVHPAANACPSCGHPIQQQANKENFAGKVIIVVVLLVVAALMLLGVRPAVHILSTNYR